MLTADMKSRIAEALAHVASIIADRRSAHYTSPFDFAFTCETAEELAGFVTALLAHIQAQSEQLRQAKAEGAMLLMALEPMRHERPYYHDNKLPDTTTITSYAARVARMEEALQAALEFHANFPLSTSDVVSDFTRRASTDVYNKLAALEGDG